MGSCNREYDAGYLQAGSSARPGALELPRVLPGGDAHPAVPEPRLFHLVDEGVCGRWLIHSGPEAEFDGLVFQSCAPTSSPHRTIGLIGKVEAWATQPCLGVLRRPAAGGSGRILLGAGRGFVSYAG